MASACDLRSEAGCKEGKQAGSEATAEPKAAEEESGFSAELSVLSLSAEALMERAEEQ